MKLYLIRHGETDHNVARRIQGPLIDDPLNERGRLQAKLLEARFEADRARGVQLAAVYSSPLRRARETADALARGAGLARPVAPLPEMIEFSWGVYLGREEKDILPDMHAIHEKWEAGDVDHAPPQGESPQSAWNRARRGLEPLFERHRHDSVAIVAHGRINKIVLAALVARDLARMEQFPQGNTSVTLVTQDALKPFDAPWRLVYVNDKEHLAGVAESLPGSRAEGEPPLV